MIHVHRERGPCEVLRRGLGSVLRQDLQCSTYDDELTMGMRTTFLV